MLTREQMTRLTASEEWWWQQQSTDADGQLKASSAVHRSLTEERNRAEPGIDKECFLAGAGGSRQSFSCFAAINHLRMHQEKQPTAKKSAIGKSVPSGAFKAMPLRATPVVA